MKKIFITSLGLIISIGMLGCTKDNVKTNTPENKPSIEQGEHFSEEKGDNPNPEEMVQPNEGVEQMEVPEENEGTMPPHNENREQMPAPGANEDFIEMITIQLDKLVEEGTLTTEEREQLIEEAKNGQMENVSKYVKAGPERERKPIRPQ